MSDQTQQGIEGQLEEAETDENLAVIIKGIGIIMFASVMIIRAVRKELLK